MKVEKLLGILEDLDELHGICMTTNHDTIEIDVESLTELIEDVKELILKVRI